jgi:hypothetical protein
MNARVKIHIEKLMGAIPISIVETVHGQRTRVLTIPISVELEDITIEDCEVMPTNNDE